MNGDKGVDTQQMLSNLQLPSIFIVHQRIYTTSYLKSLHTSNHISLLQTARKTGILGFIVAMESVKSLYFHLVGNCNFSYFLTYKVSQDHIEILFSKIRQRGGFNNNPSVSQFKAAIKAISVNKMIRASDNANVLQFQSHDMEFDFRQSKRRSEVIEHPDDMFSHTEICSEWLFDCSRSEWKMNVLFYISGFVVKKLLPKVACDVCRDALIYDPKDSADPAGYNMHDYLIRSNEEALYAQVVEFFL